MGSGKGNPEHWVAVVASRQDPLRARRRGRGARPLRPWTVAIQKLPMKARVIARPGLGLQCGGAGLMRPPAELRELDDAELDDKLVEARKELFNLRFQAATGQVRQLTRVGRQVRREIARMLTVQRAHEIELAESEEAVAGRAHGRRSSDGREQRTAPVPRTACRLMTSNRRRQQAQGPRGHRRREPHGQDGGRRRRRARPPPPSTAKTVQRTRRLYVHDEKNEATTGDRVRVAETRPFSKLKRWRLVEVLERAR